MNQAESADLAREMARFRGLEASRSGDDRDTGRIHGAVFDQLFEFVPEGAIAALVQRDEDNAAVVAAVSGAELYLLECLDFEDDVGQPPTSCRMIHLEPGRAQVEVETKYRPPQGGSAPRSAKWRFHFREEDLTLTIETHVGPDGEVDRRETLARTLAAECGWSMDSAARNGPN